MEPSSNCLSDWGWLSSGTVADTQKMEMSLIRLKNSSFGYFFLEVFSSAVCSSRNTHSPEHNQRFFLSLTLWTHADRTTLDLVQESTQLWTDPNLITSTICFLVFYAQGLKLSKTKVNSFLCTGTSAKLLCSTL